ncbi:MAG: DUF4142 domain-containing protein, partial [Ramlibacter sp.]|nr:DUF4142 domain-containing protein [Ramlibacter sp.]
MKKYARCLLAAAAVSLSIAASAQGDEPSRDPSPGLPNAEQQKAPVVRTPLFAAASAASARRLAPEQLFERGFLKQAAANTRFEFEAARMALSKSASPEVRVFADTIVSHHLAVTPVLQQMLHARGMAAPMLENGQRKALNSLAKVTGRKFDQEFITVVGLKSQQDDVQLFERASAGVRDTALKDWVDRTLPVLKSNLASAEQVPVPGLKMAKAVSHSTMAQRPGQPPATQMMGAGPTPS